MGAENREQENGWLDEALKQYSTVEPRTGLEGRILTRLRTEERQRARGWYWLGPVLAGATVALAIVLYLFNRPAEVMMPSARIVGAPQSPKMDTNAGLAIVPARRTRGQVKSATTERSTVHPVALPKNAQFPSAAPLSEQEQILARYVREHYETAVLVARARAELAQREQLENEMSDKLRFGKTDHKPMN